MAKFLITIFSIIFVSFAIFFSESNRETHSLFYVRGDDIHEIAKKDGSFGTAPAFFIVEKISIIENKIPTGEYEIKKNETAISVILKMISGKGVIRKLTIPEGHTVKMILDVINNNPLLFGKISESLQEASLAPDTYFYKFGDSKVSIIQKMKNQMEKIRIRFASENKTNLSCKDIMILASIIEKESGNIEEMKLISSVFHNRLKIKMRLQSDPTVIYALTEGYGKMDRNLTRQDLWFESPYNTYRNGGLPPTPICCPGVEAIKAAMNPERTDYFYFVAEKNKRKHIFSKEYNTHLKAIKAAKSAS